MGLFNFLKGQFIEVIEWTNSNLDTIVYRFPVMNKEIKMGAKLTVRESQVAIFINEGQIADVFTPGLYELTTQNLPILTKLKSWKYGFNSPFKAEVYFVNTRQFTDQKWGTTNPVMMRDPEFGMLRLRAFGIYSFKVLDPVIFMKEIFGTSEIFDTEHINGQLKRLIVSGMSDLLAETNIAALDLARYYDELGEQSTIKLKSRFEAMGLSLTNIIIENISLPEEVEKVMDKRTSMGVIGNIDQYAKYQASEAIRDAAQNQGNGFAGMGAGLGAGSAIGTMMNNALNTVNSNQAASTRETVKCKKCSTEIDKNSKFCPECGETINLKIKCIKCNAEIQDGVKFCPECGSPQNTKKLCSNCSSELDLNAKFCPECGAKS
ncbi:MULTISPECIES: SPFH domain-containing protein [unclassified Clostridium]|uniref:SPFH domain-containing protein n=1 Tax=unclassified Clostridium TaxID=2614128 RepID=UPI0025BFDB1E|nr:MULTISPECIES: SPFH domain-containing protein [unclassified Clostridium]